ncbi:MAG: hypothetical protein PUF45_06100 [Lachnospiraceae bacterium]|nr:hypothetical protein [Lachnospiraceae bacterium]
MRIWFKLYEDTRLIQDVTIEKDGFDTRTHKVFQALEDACNHFDLAKPIWLDANVEEFRRHSKTKFRQVNFIEEIAFDYLEMQVLEEDF